MRFVVPLMSLLAVALAIVKLGGPMAQTQASDQCPPFVEHYHSGYAGYVRWPNSWNETPEGVAATIQVRDPVHLCNFGTASRGSAWITLVDINNARWAQTGYLKDWFEPCLYRYTEWIRLNGVPQQDYWPPSGGCLTPGSSLQFAVTYTGPAGPYPQGCFGRLAMIADGYGWMTQTDYDPWCTGWAFGPQYEGETNYPTNDMPGIPGAEAHFTPIWIQSVDTGVLRLTPCYLLRITSLSRYHANANSCTHFWIWTQ